MIQLSNGNRYPGEQLEYIDIYRLIHRLNPAYVEASRYSDPHEARVNFLCYSLYDGRLYIVFGNAYIFFSEDKLHSLEEISEINYNAGKLIPSNKQSIHSAVETLDGSMLFAGRDRRANDLEAGIVWRKSLTDASFKHSVVVENPGWKTSMSSKMTSGYFGNRQRKMVALAIYATNAHFYYSFDDGLTWKKHKMNKYFKKHVHEVYLPSSLGETRKGRLWVTGGDDPSGDKSGLLYIDSKTLSGLGKPRWVFREEPGYRLVSISGNGKNVFVGNESVAGGMLKIQDNQETIAAKDFEYIFGKFRHDYHLFRTLYATFEGIVVSGTSSYRDFGGDSIRGDSGGIIYISNNEGATFTEIPLGETWITSVAYDGAFFWFSTSANRESGRNLSKNRYRILKVSKPSPYIDTMTPYVCKALLVDSSEFYKSTGSSVHPKATLSANERTLKTDLSAYKTVILAIETLSAGTLTIEAVPFYNWSLETTPWYDIKTVTFDGPIRREIPIPHKAIHNRWFRVRNSGEGSIEIRFLAFIGKK